MKNCSWDGRISFWKSLDVDGSKKPHFYNKRQGALFDILEGCNESWLTYMTSQKSGSILPAEGPKISEGF